MMNHNPMKRTIMVSECFGVTIQGEGALIGKPTVFVRTGGCDKGQLIKRPAAYKSSQVK